MFARARLISFVAVCLSVCGVVFAQSALPKNCLTTLAASPCVEKVDPPNWWARLPSPMLLLRGSHLADAKVAVRGSSVAVKRTQASANGHYLFIWLETKGAGPEGVTIEVSNSAGSTAVPFGLNQPRAASDGFHGFSSRDVMYLIMPDRFADGDTANDPHPSERSLPRGWHGGDLRGIEQHLDYLQQLGVTTIWTTPVYSNAGGTEDYHGYSATDMYAVDPHLGTLADYVHLAQAVHARGMKLVLDTVPNHVGAANPWAKDPPAPDWFHGSVMHHSVSTGDFRPLTDPHASWAEQKDITQGWFVNLLPDLNQQNPLVRQYLIQNAVWWVETAGLDGLRLDTFPYVGRAFWHDFHAELHALFPNVTTVGEVYGPDPTVNAFFAGGVAREGRDGDIDTGLYTPFDYPMYFALRGVLTGKQPMSSLEDVLREDYLYPHPERLVTFIGNHDTMRFLNEPGATVGDLKIGFALLATLRGMPELYSGDEIAMRGGNDPDNRHDFPGGFPGDPANAFTAAGRSPEQQDVFERAVSLFHFRAQHPALQTGKQQDIFMDKTVFAFVRADDVQHGCSDSSGDRVLVVVNHATMPRTLTLQQADTALARCRRFTAAMGSPEATSIYGTVSMRLGPEQVGIYVVQ